MVGSHLSWTSTCSSRRSPFSICTISDSENLTPDLPENSQENLNRALVTTKREEKEMIRNQHQAFMFNSKNLPFSLTKKQIPVSEINRTFNRFRDLTTLMYTNGMLLDSEKVLKDTIRKCYPTHLYCIKDGKDMLWLS